MGNYKKKGKPQKVCECGEKFLGVGKYCYDCKYTKKVESSARWLKKKRLKEKCYNKTNERVSKKNTKNSL